MVKLAGPAMSLDASGTIGGVLTFSKWKGRPYVRVRTIPANPKTMAQLAVRASMKFLSQAWAGLSTAEQNTFNAMADARKISPFNAFCSFNQAAWRDGYAPSKETPADRTTAAALISNATLQQTGRYAGMELDLGAAAGQWGAAVFMGLVTGFTPSWNNVRAIVPALPSAATTLLIGPLAAADYFFRFWTFSTDGKWNASFVTEEALTIT